MEKTLRWASFLGNFAHKLTDIAVFPSRVALISQNLQTIHIYITILFSSFYDFYIFKLQALLKTKKQTKLT